jgi:hydrogenase expression/formation protein HypE
MDLEFETTIESDTTNLNHLVKKILDEHGDQIHFLRDPTRGGVATVMNELAGFAKLGNRILSRMIFLLMNK